MVVMTVRVRNLKKIMVIVINHCNKSVEGAHLGGIPKKLGLCIYVLFPPFYLLKLFFSSFFFLFFFGFWVGL